MVRYMLEVLLLCSDSGLRRGSIRRRMLCGAIVVVQERRLIISESPRENEGRLTKFIFE
jgi:hypothetical protein